MTDTEPTRGNDGVVLSDADRVRMRLDDGKLRCRRCHAELTAPVVWRHGHPAIRCACGLETRVVRTPRAVEPRQKPRGSKRERGRARVRRKEAHERQV